MSNHIHLSMLLMLFFLIHFISLIIIFLLHMNLVKINCKILLLPFLFIYTQILNLSNDVNFMTHNHSLKLIYLFINNVLDFWPISVILHHLHLYYFIFYQNLFKNYFLKMMYHFHKTLVLIL